MLDFFLGALADVRMSLSDQFQGQALQLFEVIAGKSDFIRRIAQPFDIILNLLDVLMRFFIWVGIVVAQVASASSSEGSFEIDPHGFEMSNMKVAIGLWRKSEPSPARCDCHMFSGNLFGVALNLQQSWFDVLQFIPKLIFLPLRFPHPLRDPPHLLVNNLAINGRVLLPQCFTHRIHVDLLLFLDLG